MREVLLDDYVFDAIGVPLAEGLIGLGGDRWALQDQATVRLAAILSRTGDDRGWVRFADLTVSRAAATSRRFYVLEGLSAAEALSIARAVNR